MPVSRKAAKHAKKNSDNVLKYWGRPQAFDEQFTSRVFVYPCALRPKYSSTL
jgi:hypothetical protein